MDWLGDNMWAAWLGAAALLGVAEMLSLDLVLIMLAVGALAGMVLAIVGAPVGIQILVALGVSVAMLGVVRPTLAKRLHGGPDLNLGHGKLVGQRGVVTEAITENQHGRVKLAGEIWSAAPYDENVTIAAGETVEVLQIKGATAYVHAVPRLEA
ncbi:MAG TPA: NfeD family protein [Nocardioides sp.]|nr:NfeD family protein [Nocardioides sp.]